MLKQLLALATALCLAGLPAIADDFDSAGVRIHYVEQGAGEPIILIHGLYASAQMNWAPQVSSPISRSITTSSLSIAAATANPTNPRVKGITVSRWWTTSCDSWIT